MRVGVSPVYTLIPRSVRYCRENHAKNIARTWYRDRAADCDQLDGDLYYLSPGARSTCAGVQGYIDFLAGQTWIKPLLNSVQITLLSTSTAVLLGFIYAYAMVYSHMPWKPFFRLVGILPLLSPPFVVAASYILLFGPRGIISYRLFWTDSQHTWIRRAVGGPDDCLFPLRLPVDC